ncbi:MAG: methyltransferase [Deltaproteobacteria bacterium]|nr:methyltransferase [Deltaproteobacteria bacterium]
MRVNMALGLLIGALGLLWLAWAWRELGWRRWLDLGDTPQHTALPRLVLYGPFRRVRHPQTLGLLLVLLAEAVRWNRIGMWGAALLSSAVVVYLARRDERRLAQRFGEAYRRYQRAVPMLLPRVW